MELEWLPPKPATPTEALIRVELTETELRAIINRLVPEGTWMKVRSASLIRQVDGDQSKADETADEITDMLIRAHDDQNDPRWRRRV